MGSLLHHIDSRASLVSSTFVADHSQYQVWKLQDLALLSTYLGRALYSLELRNPTA